MKWFAAGIGMLAITALPASGAAAASLADDVSVSVDPASSTVTLGETLDISVEVVNRSGQTIRGLVVHIDITSLADAGSVDPEDWTSTLSKPIADLAPEGVTRVDWRIQPISAGDFSLYAVALTGDDATVAASNVLRVTVDDQRSLNPNGILPVSIGAPVLIGGLLALQVRLARSNRRRPAPA